jgi:hypothetical protein
MRSMVEGQVRLFLTLGPIESGGCPSTPELRPAVPLPWKRS